MSSKNGHAEVIEGTIEVEGITVSKEEAEKAFEHLDAVNMDEVSNEVIAVKVRHYKFVDVLDDDGDPVPDEQGKPLKARKVSTRTAHILNFVPTSLYHKVINYQGKMAKAGFEGQVNIFRECVLEVWQVSEPFMTEKMLSDGVDLPVIMALFKRFFGPNLLSKLRV